VNRIDDRRTSDPLPLRVDDGHGDGSELRLAIMVSVLSINSIGDALRDALDPRLRGTLK
jgi:hypothetical protein